MLKINQENVKGSVGPRDMIEAQPDTKLFSIIYLKKKKEEKTFLYKGLYIYYTHNIYFIAILYIEGKKDYIDEI
jgi:hypothetical protein